MKIKRLAYYDKANDWQLEPIEFNDDLNLLVGVSGVGKTQILITIINLRLIANGKALNGVTWDITFLISNEFKYRWQGEFENLGLSHNINNPFRHNDKYNDDSDDDTLPQILYEKLSLNGEEIINRTKDEIIFKGEATLKLSPAQSIIKLLSQEMDIAPVFKGFSQITNSKVEKRIILGDFKKHLNQLTTLDTIQNSKLSTFQKLPLINHYVPEIFEEIKTQFITIFPHVEDVKTEALQQDNLPLDVIQFPFVQIKERHINHWILPWQFSEGMAKTLAIISDMYLLPEGSVLLIDELENSLGMNCIDPIGDWLSQERGLQLIVTSHHPYIINTIDMKYWKILTRHGGVVRVRQANEFERLAKKSMHDNYTRLLEIDEITQGIE